MYLDDYQTIYNLVRYSSRLILLIYEKDTHTNTDTDTHRYNNTSNALTHLKTTIKNYLKALHSQFKLPSLTEIANRAISKIRLKRICIKEGSCFDNQIFDTFLWFKSIYSSYRESDRALGSGSKCSNGRVELWEVWTVKSATIV